jgi:hypothetical protein
MTRLAWCRCTCGSSPALGDNGDHVDMIIGEVKEGRAELNRGATRPAVLRAALLRFGCCSEEQVPAVVDRLLERGHAVTSCSHRVRLVAFGSYPGEHGNHDTILLGHVIGFLESYIQSHWALLRHAQFKDSTFNLLVTLQKARQSHQE